MPIFFVIHHRLMMDSNTLPSWSLICEVWFQRLVF
nr:MAG TPA: hypothetical protein [Caudoviricetes sp.]